MFITATTLNCYLLQLLWNKTLNLSDYSIIFNKKIWLEKAVIEETVVKFQVKPGFFGPNENSASPSLIEFPHNPRHINSPNNISDSIFLDNPNNISDSKPLSHVKTLQDSKPLISTDLNPVDSVPQEIANNKNCLNDIFNIRSKNIYDNDIMEKRYNNLIKRFTLTEDKKEFLSHKRTFVQDGIKFKLDLYTGLINNISDTIFRIIRITSEHWIYYFPFF